MQENFNVVKNIFEFDMSRNVFKRPPQNVLNIYSLAEQAQNALRIKNLIIINQINVQDKKFLKGLNKPGIFSKNNYNKSLKRILTNCLN